MTFAFLRASTECDIIDCTDIVRVAAGAAHTVGLESDGAVAAAGLNANGQCLAGGWMLE